MDLNQNHVNIKGIDFVKVEAGITTVGTNKGGWVYASNRPMHEVKIPDSFIMKSVFPSKLLNGILPSYDSLDSGDEYTGIDRKLIEELLSFLNSEIPEGYEIRESILFKSRSDFFNNFKKLFTLLISKNPLIIGTSIFLSLIKKNFSFSPR